MNCPYCKEWMPCTTKTEMWQGVNYVTILSYACEECGRLWNDGPDGFRPVGFYLSR